MKKLIIISIVILGLLALILFLRINKTNNPEVLKVGIATWPGFAPGYIANNKGFFGDLKVEFIIIDDFIARQTAYTTNKTDATIGTIDSYAFDQGNNIDGKLIMILDQSNGADGIVVKPNINEPNELKGKKIAYTRGSPSHFFLLQILKTANLTIDSIVPIEVDDPGKAGEAFISGSVDAAVTWEPNISQIVATGKGKVLRSTKTTPGLIVDGLIVSLDSYNNRKKDIQKFVNGWLEAVKYIQTNPKESYEIMAKNLSIQISDFPAMAEGLVYADRNINQEWLLPQDNSKAKLLYDEATKMWEKLGLIKYPKFDDNLIKSDFIK